MRSPPTYNRALDAAARKQFVLGGAEIVALAVVAVIALKVVITKGVGQSGSSTRVTMYPDGRVDIAFDESKKAVTITEDLAAMVLGTLGTLDKGAGE